MSSFAMVRQAGTAPSIPLAYQISAEEDCVQGKTSALGTLVLTSSWDGTTAQRLPFTFGASAELRELPDEEASLVEPSVTAAFVKLVRSVHPQRALKREIDAIEHAFEILRTCAPEQESGSPLSPIKHARDASATLAEWGANPWAVAAMLVHKINPDDLHRRSHFAYAHLVFAYQQIEAKLQNLKALPLETLIENITRILLVEGEYTFQGKSHTLTDDELLDIILMLTADTYRTLRTFLPKDLKDRYGEREINLAMALTEVLKTLNLHGPYAELMDTIYQHTNPEDYAVYLALIEEKQKDNLLAVKERLYAISYSLSDEDALENMAKDLMRKDRIQFQGKRLNKKLTPEEKAAIRRQIDAEFIRDQVAVEIRPPRQKTVWSVERKKRTVRDYNAFRIILNTNIDRDRLASEADKSNPEYLRVKEYLFYIERALIALLVKQHRLRPITKERNDYVNKPKPNGYQAIQNTFCDPRGVEYEFQIRSAGMHAWAEYGGASHLAYKDPEIQLAPGENPPLTVLHRIKEEQAGYIYVVLARPDDQASQLVRLPRRATLVDLAYKAERDKFEKEGQRLVGARINGQEVSEAIELENGQCIELQFSDRGRGLTTAVTPLAVTLMEMSRVAGSNVLSNQRTGRALLLAKGITDFGLNSPQLEAAAAELGFGNTGELFACLGMGSTFSNLALLIALNLQAQNKAAPTPLVRRETFTLTLDLRLRKDPYASKIFEQFSHAGLFVEECVGTQGEYLVSLNGGLDELRLSRFIEAILGIKDRNWALSYALPLRTTAAFGLELTIPDANRARGSRSSPLSIIANNMRSANIRLLEVEASLTSDGKFKLKAQAGIHGSHPKTKLSPTDIETKLKAGLPGNLVDRTTVQVTAPS